MSNKKRLQLEALEMRALLAADLGVDPQDLVESTGATEFASIDGTGNNVDNTQWGSTDEQLLRTTTAEYGDGISTPAGEDRPSAREVSNAVVAQTDSVINDRYLTDITWLWGQFIDHDIDLTENADPAEAFNIEVPTGDEFFDPDGTGDQEIELNRSVYDETTGDSLSDPRQQINQITAFIDGSVIYGSDQERADALRTFEGGHLEMTDEGLLPWNDEGLANAGGTSDELFLAGDVRANENAALTAMHTLWVREHNRIADEISAADPSLSDEAIYQEARSIVTAQLQAITFNEYLPALLGVDALDTYQGYDSTVDPGISNIFSTAAYRFGHSMLSSELLRLNSDGTVADEGNLDLASAFFAPQEIVNFGIESLLLGATSQQAQEIDTMVIDDVRNFLFGPPGAGGFDLASLNIQRGRDHGLPDYNQAREDLGLERVTSFSEITSDPALAAELEALYGDVDNIDVWVGGLAEDHVAGSSMGELFSTVLVDQFQRLRDGDRFWYENVFSGRELQEINNTTLADVIQRNTDITDLRDNVFFDASVLYYEAGDGRGDGDVTVVINDQTVSVVDSRGRTIESRDVAAVSQVMVVGSDARQTNVTIDMRTDSAAPEGGIVVYGGADGRDTLTVRGMRGADEIVVDGRSIAANETSIEQSGFETIRIVETGRNDSIQIVDDGGSDVQIVRDQNRRDNRNDRNDRNDRNAPPPGQGANEQFVDAPSDGDRNNDQRRAVDPTAGSLAGLRASIDVGAELDAAIEVIARDVGRLRR